jgi:4-diphosphocytidyl-2-C-methyl-D-erythritol kinase
LAIVERAAPAKVNLALHVLGRRPDGYHDLDTLAVFADFGDRIAVSDARELSVSVSGRFAGIVPCGSDNLVLRAARLLQEHAAHRTGADVRLHKNLPAGSGFGGASADAAATLHALAALWRLGLGAEALADLAAKLGADVPMCLARRALRARGTGERIDLLGDWPPLPLLLVWPGRSVSTAAVFASLQRRENPPLPALPGARSPLALAAWLSRCRNDLEAASRVLAPEIGDVLTALRATEGCVLARMSGSGSGCFGLYLDRRAAAAAAAYLRNIRPGWWIVVTDAA